MEMINDTRDEPWDWSNIILTNTTEVWGLVVTYGEYIRGHKLDGLVAWNALKELLAKHSHSIEWSQQCLGFFDGLQNCGIVEIHDPLTMTHHEWERHHFMIQHGRIPHRNANKGDLVRLFQIAYNSGQFSIERRAGEFSKDSLSYFYNNHLNYISSYVDLDTLNVTDDLVDQLRAFCKKFDMDRELWDECA